MQVNLAPPIANGPSTTAGAALVRDPELPLLDVLLESLTETEAHFSSSGTLPVGTVVRTWIAGAGTILGQVAQPDPRGITINFADPISPRVVARALAAGSTNGIAIPLMTREGSSASNQTAAAQSIAGAPVIDRPGLELTLSPAALALLETSHPPGGIAVARADHDVPDARALPFSFRANAGARYPPTTLLAGLLCVFALLMAFMILSLIL